MFVKHDGAIAKNAHAWHQINSAVPVSARALDTDRSTRKQLLVKGLSPAKTVQGAALAMK